jgi:hypothetical protein
MASDTKNYVLGRGKLYFDPYASGTKTPTGERYIGNTTEFNLTVESDTLDHYDSDRGVRTKDDSVILELNRTGSLTTDNIAEENIGLFILGELSDYDQDGTPVTGEAIGEGGIPLTDRYYQLGVTTANPQGVRGVSSVTVTIDPNGTSSSAVEDTDYTLDAELARLYIMEGGAIDGQTEASVGYTPETNTRKRITTQASTSVEGAVRFISYNAKGKNKDVYMPYVTLTPSGDFALKGDDWQNMAFSVEVGELPGQSAIYVDGRPA